MNMQYYFSNGIEANACDEKIHQSGLFDRGQLTLDYYDVFL